MKVYIIAITIGKYAYRVGSLPKVYKSKKSAQKALDKFMIENPNEKDVKILCADKWDPID